MTRRALALAAAALAACAAGGAGQRTLVRIDPPRGRAPPEAPLADAVRSVAAEDRMACRAGTGATVLSCSPGDVGTRPVHGRLELRRAGDGYEVVVDAPFARAGDAGVCNLQRRLARAVDVAIGPFVRLPPSSGCPDPADAPRPGEQRM